ncbi:MAG: universal stress protein [Flavobacteriales bacterium]|jgi:nucleotide-binding universal stress UspA family protein
MTSKDIILVPIGFTNQSLVALRQAVIVAKHTNSELFLLSVVEMPTALQKIFSDYEEKQKQFKDKLRENLVELSNKYCEGVSNVKCLVSSGKIYEEITDVAESVGASLIVMGTDGTPKDIKKKFIGSNANKVVRSAPCPVITIKGKSISDSCDLIALPLDLNKETREKVTNAIQFARLFNSEIRAFSVSYTNDDETTKNKLNRTLSQVSEFITSKGVKCSTELIEISSSASFSGSIVKYTEDIYADLIMIMTKGEENLDLNFLGSNARKLINKSDIPVMSIRPAAKKDTSSFTIQ